VAVVFIILEIIAIRSYADSTPYTQARLLSWSNEVAGYFHSAFAGITNYFSLRQENENLTEHIATLENHISQLEANMPEEVIEVDSLLQQYQYVAARVVASSTNHSRNFITLNKGANDGVTPDMAVMTPEGYAVGLVVDCSDNFAVAMMLLNMDMRIGGVHVASGSDGPEGGNKGSVEWNGEDTQIVDFLDVPKYANIENGDSVCVYSRYFPSSAIIGNIESVQLAESGTTYNCKIRLAADMGRLFNVILVRNNFIEELTELEAPYNN
jgi:rod shape-determining protein MreC